MIETDKVEPTVEFQYQTLVETEEEWYDKKSVTLSGDWPYLGNKWCPLCKINEDCSTCPIFIYGKRYAKTFRDCKNTPYLKVWKARQKVIKQPSSDKFRTILLECIVKEIDFLKEVKLYWYTTRIKHSRRKL